MVGNLLVGKASGGEELDDVECGERHVVEVEGGEVGEFVEGVGLGV